MMFGTVTALAGSVTIPNAFQAGTKAVAAEVNQYRGAVDANARAVAVIELARFDHADGMLMVQAAAINADSVVRYVAVEALWRMAADGLDSEGRIQELLQQAAFDTELQVAELATRALSDLYKLRIQNKQAKQSGADHE